MSHDDWNPHEQHTCHDCDCQEGELHQPGCDMEACPFCGGQLIACGCIYKLCGFPDYKGFNEQMAGMTHEEGLVYLRTADHESYGLPKNIYEKGPPKKMVKEFGKLLEEKGRIRYILYPNLCRRCGKIWPDMFNLTDVEWKTYVAPEAQREMLCRPCYDWIKKVQDESP